MRLFRLGRHGRAGGLCRRAPGGLVCFIALLGSTAFGQAPNRSASRFDPDWSHPAELLLRNAAGHARDRQWAEAITLYQRVIEQFGDKVAKLPKEEPGTDPSGEFVLYVDDRRFCHRSLAHMPPEARQIYRSRVDPLAERWFRQGAREADEASLRRVVDQAFCSSWGDDALELLGDLAFQDGRFGEALANYNRLVADRPDDPFSLVHPDPSVDLTRVAAKKLLCRAALGESPPSQADLDEFARRYPKSSGSLAGRTGDYAQILALALRSDRLALPSQPESRWPTFAGSLKRTKVAAGPIDAGSVQWRVELDRVALARGAPFYGPRGMSMQPPASPERLLAFHPIVLGDQVIITDGARVLAYNLNDRPRDAEGSIGGSVEPAWKYDPESADQRPQALRVGTGIPRYTLTAVGHRIFVRTGGMSPPYFPGMGSMGARGTSSIIALDWATQGKLLWEQKSTAIVLPNRPADRSNNRTVSFEGTPVADARNVYVAVTDRREQTATYIACFDAENGASRWVRYLGTAASEIDNFVMNMPMQFGVITPGDFNHRLLSLDGPTLYYQTNLGALVALEAETGRALWVATYPRQESDQVAGGSERDLNPAVIDGGRVFVAPSDASALFAFDAGSGRLLWKSPPLSSDVKLTHLLGVAKGRLIATGDRVLSFDVTDGKLRHVWPDSGKSMVGYGRGLLAGDLIYWPTRNEIQVLNQRTGLRAEPPIKLAETYHIKGGGNLAAGDGYLIVAQADGLVVFCQNSRLIERYRDEIARAPDRAANYFRLARAAEALSRDELALDSYRLAAQKARSNETIDEVLLESAARDHQFRLLLRLAGQARRARHWTEAVARLESAAEVAKSDPDRLRAQLALADVLLDAERPAGAIALWQRLLTDERLRPLSVSVPEGQRTIRADLYISDRLASVLRAHGREAYAPYDRKAAELYERARKEQDVRLLDEVGRSYPVARVVPDALLELGSLYERTSRPADAALAYKRLLMLAPDDDLRALALLRLARAYEARKLFLAARDTYLDLHARFPHILLKDKTGAITAAELVAAELARPPYSQLAALRPQPPIPVPLYRKWHWQAPLTQPVHLLAALGIPPSLEASRVLLVEKDNLRFLDTSTGMPRWLAKVGGPVVWAGYLSDKLIAATASQIVALELGQGTVQWRYGAARSARSPDRPDPFAPAGAAKENEAGERPSEALSGFQLAKGRVFAVRGGRELIALDGDSGALDWSFSGPPGEIKSHLWIGTDRSVLQLDNPNQLLVLRTDDGQPMARLPLGEKELLERPPLPLDDDSVLLVTDRRTVKKLDLKSGQITWVYRKSDKLPVNGPPRLLGDAERLLDLHDGRTLIRLDTATGSTRWSCLLGSEDLSERPSAMAYDDKRFYCANRQTLRAISLEDGRSIWSAHLTGPSDATWSIVLSQHHVLAYPTCAGGSEGDEVENMTVIVRRRESGALVQRFVFPSTVADATFKIDPRGALVATQRGLWALGRKEQHPLSLSPR